MEKTYDVNYFIEKFEAIPEKMWYSGKFVDPSNTDRLCALGHCGQRKSCIVSQEARELASLFLQHSLYVSDVNDGLYQRFPQPTPKQRILAALRYIKSKQYPELTHPPVTAEQVIEELEGVTNITA